VALVKRLHQPGKVEQGAAEPIYPVGQNAVNVAGLDVGQELLQCWPVEVAAGVAAVVVAAGQAGPAGMGLAVDIGFRRFALGVRRVDVLVESLLGTFARVDRTAHWRGRV
jgi:hypothetical protein